jgi:hypothetical protein
MGYASYAESIVESALDRAAQLAAHEDKFTVVPRAAPRPPLPVLLSSVSEVARTQAEQVRVEKRIRWLQERNILCLMELKGGTRWRV